MKDVALLEVRALPWRPRARVMSPRDLRDLASNADPLAVDDISGLALSLALMLVLFLAAPLVVLLLAIVLLPFEIAAVVIVAAGVLVARFCGVIPWTVVTVDGITGQETRSRYRTVWAAAREVRAVNGRRRVPVRWAWT
jgi:hypothetical protein